MAVYRDSAIEIAGFLRGDPVKAIVVGDGKRMSQYQKPRGWLGRFVLWQMNSRHSKLTDWGLSHVSIAENYTILDVGCGGGRTLSKLGAAAKQGKVYGVDHSEESVAASKRTNARWINVGRVEENAHCMLLHPAHRKRQAPKLYRL